MTCFSHGGKCIFQWIKSFDVTINDKDAVNIVRQGIENFINKEAIYEDVKPFMAAEDFGYYLKNTKGAMFWVGFKSSERRTLHSSKLSIDDDVLLVGIKTYWCIQHFNTFFGQFFRNFLRNQRSNGTHID